MKTKEFSQTLLTLESFKTYLEKDFEIHEDFIPELIHGLSKVPLEDDCDYQVDLYVFNKDLIDLEGQPIPLDMFRDLLREHQIEKDIIDSVPDQLLKEYFLDLFKEYKAYRSFHCSCDYDCCGHISSRTVYTTYSKHLELFFIRVVRTNFNY